MLLLCIATRQLLIFTYHCISVGLELGGWEVKTQFGSERLSKREKWLIHFSFFVQPAAVPPVLSKVPNLQQPVELNSYRKLCVAAYLLDFKEGSLGLLLNVA